MKRTERHHLKENELHNLARQARETVRGARGAKRPVIIAALVVVGCWPVGYFVWRERVKSRAHALLAEALTSQSARVGPPPRPGTRGRRSSFRPSATRSQAALAKFKAAADAYPVDRRRHLRAVSGRRDLDWRSAIPTQAIAAYQQVIDRAGDSIYGQMARLGLAEAQARTGQYDQAINTFKDLAQRKDGPLPVDGILMQLGRDLPRCRQARGRAADLQPAGRRNIPESPFSGDARRELETLKKT